MPLVNLYPYLNQSATPGQFTWTPSAGTLNFTSQSKIALVSSTVNYTWRNITAAYQNDSLSYTWLGQTYAVSIPDGAYATVDICSVMQAVMTANTHYTLDASGNVVFYLSFAPNSTYSAVQVSSTPIPTTLGTGTLPPGATWSLPATASTPQLVIPAVSNARTSMSVSLGLAPGSYPSTVQSTPYATLSTFPPQLFPVQTIQVQCNAVVNAANPGLLFAFQPQGTYDSYLQVEPLTRHWQQLAAGSWASLILTLVDQWGNPVQLLDNNLSFVLDIEP